MAYIDGDVWTSLILPQAEHSVHQLQRLRAVNTSFREHVDKTVCELMVACIEGKKTAAIPRNIRLHSDNDLATVQNAMVAAADWVLLACVVKHRNNDTNAHRLDPIGKGYLITAVANLFGKMRSANPNMMNPIYEKIRGSGAWVCRDPTQRIVHREKLVHLIAARLLFVANLISHPCTDEANRAYVWSIKAWSVVTLIRHGLFSVKEMGSPAWKHIKDCKITNSLTTAWQISNDTANE